MSLSIYVTFMTLANFLKHIILSVILSKILSASSFRVCLLHSLASSLFLPVCLPPTLLRVPSQLSTYVGHTTSSPFSVDQVNDYFFLILLEYLHIWTASLQKQCRPQHILLVEPSGAPIILRKPDYVCSSLLHIVDPRKAAQPLMIAFFLFYRVK